MVPSVYCAGEPGLGGVGANVNVLPKTSKSSVEQIVGHFVAFDLGRVTVSAATLDASGAVFHILGLP